MKRSNLLLPILYFGLSLALPLFLAACGKDSRKEANAGSGFQWSSFPIPVYVDGTIWNDSANKNDLEDAMAFWEVKAGKALFDRKGEWTGANPPFSGPADNPDEFFGNVITFLSPWAGDSNVAGKTHVLTRGASISGALILVNPGTSFCHGDCVGHFADTSMRRLFAHELGHFLGLEHSNTSSNIMYPSIPAGGALNTMEVDSVKLKALTL